MKTFRYALAALALLVGPANAQWQVPNHSVPVGQGGGNIGFNSAAPGTAGRVLASNGASSDPSFQQPTSVWDAVCSSSVGQFWTRLTNAWGCSSLGYYNPAWYGAIGDGVSHPLSGFYASLAAAQAVYPFAVSLTDEIDWAATQSAVNAAGAATNPYGPRGKVYVPAGYFFVFNESLIFNVPIDVDFNSWISWTPTTGTAVKQMTVPPTKGFENFNIHFAGLVAANGNTGQPLSINSSGSSAIQINMMWFSRLRVDNVYNFTKYAIYCDGTGDVISQAAGGAQHNDIYLGQIVNNGVGVKFESANAATTSCEANRVVAADIYQNYDDIELDSTNGLGATTSNTFDIQSIDNAQNKGIDVWGSYNTFLIGYIGTSIAFNGPSSFNSCTIGNNFSTGLVIAYGGTSNWCTAPAPNSFPTTQAIASGTAYQNSYGPPVQVCFNTFMTSSTVSGTTGAAAVIGPTSTPAIAVTTPFIAAASPAITLQVPSCFLVPPGWYWKVTTSLGTGGSPSVAYSTAQITQAGQ